MGALAQPPLMLPWAAESSPSVAAPRVPPTAAQYLSNPTAASSCFGISQA